ncbi:MAG: OmpH family outer membrane protein [Methylococcales bacterium]
MVDLIEQNRRRSGATLRILRLKIGQKWPEDEMRDVQVISGRFLTWLSTHLLNGGLVMKTQTTQTQKTIRYRGDLLRSFLLGSYKRAIAIRIQGFFQILAFSGLVGFGGVLMPVHAGEVITIGQADSPVLSKVAKKRARKDARALIKTMRQEMKAEIKAMKDEMKAEIKKLPKGQRKAARMQGKIERKAARKQKRAEIKALRQQLKAGNVDAVIANLANINPTEDDIVLVQAAQEEGIPVALENVSADKMAKLVGVGVDVDMVVVETRANGGQVLLNIWDDEAVTLEDSEGSARGGLPPNVTPEQRAELEEKAKSGKPRHPPLPKGPQAKSKVAPTSNSFQQATTDVEHILTMRPYSKGAEDLALSDKYNNYCDRSVTTACHEFQTAFLPYYWCPDGYCSHKANLNAQFSFGMYVTPISKYIVFQTVGSVGADLMHDAANYKGYFLESFKANYTPLGVPSGWVLDETAPQNANNTGSVTSTTGFSFGVSAGADKKGPNAGASASYSSSTSVKTDLTDWKVINHNVPPKAKWTFKLSKTGVGVYDDWEDIFDWKAIEGWYLGSLPDMSKYGFQPRTEAVWRGPASTVGTITFESHFEMLLRYSWVIEYFVWRDYRMDTDKATWIHNWVFNLGYIH